MNKFRMGVIGFGQRGTAMTNDVLLHFDDVEIVAVCDVYADRVEKAQSDVEKKSGKKPAGYTDYKELLQNKNLDAVYIATAWEYHAEIAIEAMKAGVPTALEVGGGYTLESLWEMVRTQEKTGTPFMLMENCCFGKAELLATSLVRNGILGDVVHCHGAYAHFLGDEILNGEKNRHYRLRNYLKRNCENYPTHELGPIAKILNINRGNRMVSLVSVASRSAGLEEYARCNADKYPEFVGKKFMQGDIVNTIITCADGSTISMTLDTTLPRFYSREFTVRGTKGLYEQGTNYVYLMGETEYFDTNRQYREFAWNADKYSEYLPPVWREVTTANTIVGHGGMDGIEFRTFIENVRDGKPLPIDVYDAASWMCISVLSEQSIAEGGAPQAIPDFTDGKWTLRPSEDVVPLK